LAQAHFRQSLNSVLRVREARSKPPVLPDTSGLLSLARYGAANLPKPALPEAEQELPKQEKGRRSRVPSAG
jgi:phospholipase C